MTWTQWWLIQPILDNKAAFEQLFPNATYGGDIGDTSHQARVSDHNPRSSDGAVMAQDFDDGGGFSQYLFFHFLLDAVRRGQYPEVQYIISQHPADIGTGYYGLFDRTYNFEKQDRDVIDHATHVHISYRVGYEHAHSQIIRDFFYSQSSKGLPEMIYTTVPTGYAYDSSAANVIEGGGSRILDIPLEWTNVAASVPTYGKVSVCIGPSFPSKQVRLRVDFCVAGTHNDDWWKNQPNVVVGGSNRMVQLPLPDGCYGVRIARITAGDSDPDQVVPVTVIAGARQ